MKLEIFHQTNPTFGLHHLFGCAALEVMEKVATLTLPEMPMDSALQQAFRLTNHIDVPWDVEHPDNLVPEPGHPRSTSVGDVVIVDGSKAFYCAGQGWDEIDIVELRGLIKGWEP